MTEFYDRLEHRDSAVREREQFARLPAHIAHAMTAPGWARHLAGIDAGAIVDRAALARLPLLRKSDLVGLQKAAPPFGGFDVAAPGRRLRLMMSPGPIFEPEGEGDDIYGTARALFAAGFRAGDIVHNAFSYHLTPGAFIFEFGAGGARLRRHSRRRRQYRAAGRCHRPSRPAGYARHAGLPEGAGR